MPNKQTYFNKLWLLNSKYSNWILEHDTFKTKARCKDCKTDINLSNMGHTALDKHARGIKHQQNCKLEPSTTLTSWLKKSSDSSSTGMTTTSTSENVDISSSTAATSSSVLPTELTGTLGTYLIKDAVIRAEILWTLHFIINHQSYNSSKGSSALLKAMFTDSPTARKFSCGRTKMAYITVFGLAPYFKQILENKLKEVPYYSISFDESYNTTTKNEQMDFSVRFWDEEKQQIVDRYLGSQFLGHARASDLLNNFNEGISNLDNKKMIQISMDGPNVNLKFYEDYVTERETIHPEAHVLLDIGSCSLHVVHGAFKTAFEESGWKLGKLLRSLWYLFKDSPARREDYMDFTGSNEFPLQFCGTRWIEDSGVAEKAIFIWKNVIKYINRVLSGPKKKIPKCASFNELSEAIKDPLVIAKLHFFVNVAKLLKPYLTLFQSEKPLVPFIGKELGKILKSIMERFLNKKVLPENQTLSSLFKVDIDELSVQLPLNKVYIGFSAKSELSEIEIPSKTKDTFRMECIVTYKTLINKLRERSPLKFDFIRQICCLSPNYINSHPSSSIGKFERVLTLMLEKNFFKGDECDELKSQYKDFISLSKLDYRNKFANYNVLTDRLDAFLFSIIGRKDEYSKLWEFIKIILTLSHGQAAIERGFSVNKNLSSTNMLQKTIVAQRIVCDGVSKILGPNDGLENFQIENALLAFVRNSRGKYEQYLKENKINSKETAIANSKKKLKDEISSELKYIENLEKSVMRLEKEANSLSEEAEREKKMSLLKDSNKSRKRSFELKEDINESKSKIKRLEKELKKIK